MSGGNCESLEATMKPGGPSGSSAVAPVLSLRDLKKTYAPGLPPVIEALNLELTGGELLTLLGPSGCGKTTTLRLIAGLERPDSGTILLNGQDITRTPPERRGIGMVFQDYALFPHLSVLQNVLFGLHRLGGPERRARAQDTLALVGLTAFETRFPHQLSGGQAQRVALARALAARPSILLLDEPFSNLDAALRHTTRQDVRQILKSSGITTLLVTHDQEEALAFSDRMVVMRLGQIEQQGTPQDVYLRPSSPFVANFLGHSNLLSGSAQGWTAQIALGQLALSRETHGAVLVSVRPEQLQLAANGEDGMEVEVVGVEFQGRQTTYRLRKPGEVREWRLCHTGQRTDPPGSHVLIRVLGQAQVLN